MTKLVKKLMILLFLLSTLTLWSQNCLISNQEWNKALTEWITLLDLQLNYLSNTKLSPETYQIILENYLNPMIQTNKKLNESLESLNNDLSNIKSDYKQQSEEVANLITKVSNITSSKKFWKTTAFVLAGVCITEGIIIYVKF